jgi:hypothetical protein
MEKDPMGGSQHPIVHLELLLMPTHAQLTRQQSQILFRQVLNLL